MSELEEYGGMKTLPNKGGVSVVQHGDDNDLPVQFFQKAIEIKFKSAQEGRPVYENRDYIRIFYTGSRDFLDRVATEKDKQRFSRQWQAYQNKEKHDWVGTPIEKFPAVDEALKSTLNHYHVYTVEQLVSASDATLEQLGMGARGLQQKAAVWLEASRATAADEEKVEMKRKLEMLIKQNEELLQRQNAVEAKAPAKKKRGRPPKKKTAEEIVLEEMNELTHDVAASDR